MKTTKREIGQIGTIARIILGVILVYFGFNSPIGDIVSPNQIEFLTSYWDDMIIGLILFPAILIIWQLTKGKFNPQQVRATGIMGTLLNTVVTIILFNTPLHHAMWFYLGFSLLVAALRGYGGCEVLAIANWVTGRNDQVGCVILSPIDALEKNK